MSDSRANERQVGGRHYKSDYEHWDWVEDWGLGYLEGSATAYVLRWREKGGLEDLHKANHYIEKLAERVRENDRTPRGFASNHACRTFVEANSIPEPESSIIIALGQWRTERDLRRAAEFLSGLIRAELLKEGKAQE